MKRFEVPQMTLVHLESENVIYASGCNTKTCDGFTCNSGFDCPDCTCSGYTGCYYAYTCNDAFVCTSHT